MRWGITGTPGTGKTSVAERLSLDQPVISLASILADDRFVADEDVDRGTNIVEMEALVEWVDSQPTDCVIESHLSHLLPIDRAIVLRCHPDELTERLEQRYGANGSTRIEENVESERYDVILIEAIDQVGIDNVFEVDTTDRDVSSVVKDVESILAGERAPESGIVSFLEDV